MLNEDNICIKYLMNELDPSEAMLVERAMMENQDLLIEIECLRETLKKVDKLPAVQPPREISEQIMQKASEQCNQSQLLSQQSYKLQQPKYYAAAAILIAGVTIGSLTFEVYPNLFSTSVSSTSSNTTTQLQDASANHANLDHSKTLIISTQANNGQNVQPWVDNNEVLHYSDTGEPGVTFINDSIKKESMKKLKPINEPVHFYAKPQTFQLTGSSQ